ncbi:MAG: CocE/NonD family hydrolase [Polyangiaceae bacterium]
MRRLGAFVVCGLLLACGEDEPFLTGQPLGGSGGDAGAAGSGGSTSAPFAVRESVEQLHVTHTEPGTKLELVDSGGSVVQSGTTDALGSLVFRQVAPGSGYEVREASAPDQRVDGLTVMSIAGSKPPQSFYDEQKLVAGVNYITVRDGTTLAAYVTLPGPPEKGPYPTVVNYSGYSPAKPGEPIGDFQSLCGNLPVLCDAPNDPSALIAALMGYATVGVNMRGTGCSGGAYDFFEPLQKLDGYDVIEVVAAQDWALHHKVGMTGLSYPGISQLFVAREKPPGLAAITPLSVIGNTLTTLAPGGILNDGFALIWAQQVLDKASAYAQGWEQARVDDGDDVCKENQLLHEQKVDIIQKARDNPFYTPEVVDPINPTDFVGEIEVPVFLACSFQDEQTGPYFFSLLDRFDKASTRKLTVYNGIHPDGFAPQVLIEWSAFLDLYVKQAVPSVPTSVRTLSPLLFNEIFKTQISLPDDRFSSFTSHADALAAYEAEPDVKVIFENGAGTPVGAPIGTFEHSLAAWPPPTTAVRYYLQPDGSLALAAPTDAFAASTFELDPEAGQRGILAPGGQLWDPLPNYAWPELAAGKAVVFDSAALTEDQVMLGSASVDLHLRADVDDADLEVNLSEIREDGQEMYVQSGWLRASHRKLAAASTELWPEHSYAKTDNVALVPGQWESVRVGIPAFAHVFRKGSKIRISVDTPGDSRAEWRFELKAFAGGAHYDIGHDAARPSSIVLPVVNIPVTTPQPACPSLRGQPCRPYVSYSNVPATP